MPGSLRHRFDGAARRLLERTGESARYVPADGTPAFPILAALDESAAEVGDYGVTVASRPAVDLLKAEVPRPQQGDLIVFGDGSWSVDRKDTDDGHIIRVWVSAP